jgi:hypothetical protein
MTGPKRDLPPLNIQITADPSKALSAYEKVISGANKMAKEVQSSIADMSKAMTTSLGSNTQKQVKAAKESLNSLPAYLRGVVSPANKAVMDGMQKSVTKQQDRFRKNLKKHTADTLKENKREVQRFLNLGAGQGKNANRLTSFGLQVQKGMLASNQSARASGLDLTDLVANAERRKQQRRAEKLRRDRQLDISARKARESEDKASAASMAARAKSLAKANASLAAQVKSGAILQKQQAIANHKQAREQSKIFWQRRKGYILAIRQSRDEQAATAAAAHSDSRRQSRKSWQHKKDYILSLRRTRDEQAATAAAAHSDSRRQSRKAWQHKRNYILSLRQSRAEQKAAAAASHEESRRLSKQHWQRKRNYILALRQTATEQKAAADAAHAESRRQSKSMWQRRRGYILALRQARAEREAIAANAAAEEHAIRRRSRIRERDRLRNTQRLGQQARKQLGSLFSGGIGSNMMGARADMFMHSGSIQNMAQSAVGFLTPFAQVENATIQMRAYAGSAEAAKEVIEDMQRFAIQSPYKLEGVLEAASNLMKYGQSAKEAMEITRMLGDVAGGNTAKLELLALATAQASGFGRLQGQELRQLVNAGFNPLKTAAQELAGGKGVATDEQIEKQMDFLLTAMRKRQLDSDIIKAALQVETSKGGDFAGITSEQARSLTGWANQFLETLDLIKIQITETFADDLKAGLETVVRYTEATVGWMKANKPLVKQYTELGLKLLKYALAFSVLGFAMATAKWIMGSMMMMLGPLKLLFVGLTTAVQLFGNTAVIAWLKFFGPIALGIGAVVALGVAIASFRNKNGFVGFVYDSVSALSYFIGFLYNFSDNMQNVFNYFGANFKRIIFDFVMSPLFDVLDVITMIANFFSGFFGIEIPSFTGKLREMGLNNIGAGPHDTSMFKFDGPQLGESKMLKEAIAKIKKELAPYLPKDIEEMIKDKPDINFKDFIKGAEGGSGQMREHTSAGSAEHALRMYQFGQQAMARFDADKKSSEKKQEELLTKIEKNTRQKAIGSGSMTIQDANLVLSAPGRID